jgi:dipeptidyl aminopeptidase/acylaminoacyl peptidase
MLAWTPDGKQLCFTSEVGPSGHHTLFLLTIASGAVKQLLPEEENALGDSSASFSPDGKWLAFARFEGANNSDLLLQRLGRDLKVEGRPIVVKEAGVSPRDPVWTPDGKRVLFLDRSRIMETTVGQPAHTLYLSDSPFTGLAASAGSARLVACRQNGREQMWTLPLTANGMKVASSPEPLAQSTAGESSPRFSPDGRWLAFLSRRTGATEVWLANFDGSNPRQLTHASFYAAGYVRWSADSRYIAFQGRLPRTPQLYIVGIENGTVRQITFSPRGFMGPSWSLDGQFLYADALEGGNNRTYSVPIAGGVPRLLFEGDDAVEVPGRKLLIYGKQDRPGIYGRSLTEDIAKSPEQLLVSDFRQPWGGFQPVPEGIYYVNGGSEGGPRAIRFYTFDTKTSVNLFPSLAEPGLGLTVMPDRSRLAYTTRPRGGEDLVELELH